MNNLLGGAIAAAEEEQRKILAELPAYGDLCISYPLYAEIAVSHRAYLSTLRYGRFQFDAFCVGCGQDSTFKDPSSRGTGAGSPVDPDWMLKPGRFTVMMSCQRHGHPYQFVFDYSHGNLQKFGQLPSIEDIAGADIRKYQSILGKSYFAELKRATGLASHGIGIGSFVYLRRIFEHLIEEHYSAQLDAGNPIEAFANMRIDEKIEVLRGTLPPALVKNKAAYGIMSKALHSLDENTCRRYFPVVRATIIEILEQDWRLREQAKVTARLEKEISVIAADLKRPSS